MLTPQEVYNQVTPSVVSVLGREDMYSTMASAGTGVIFSSNGYILTNCHVIAGCSMCRILVTNAHGVDEAYDAKVVGYDEDVDLAVQTQPRLPARGVRRDGDGAAVRVLDIPVVVVLPRDVVVRSGVGAVRRLAPGQGPAVLSHIPDPHAQADQRRQQGHAHVHPYAPPRLALLGRVQRPDPPGRREGPFQPAPDPRTAWDWDCISCGPSWNSTVKR